MLLAHMSLNYNCIPQQWLGVALGFLEGLSRVPLGLGSSLGQFLGPQAWMTLCSELRLKVCNSVRASMPYVTMATQCRLSRLSVSCVLKCGLTLGQHFGARQGTRATSYKEHHDDYTGCCVHQWA